MTVPCPLPNTGSAGGLPNTGFPLLTIIVVGTALVAAGLTVLLALRRGHRGSAVLIGALLLSAIAVMKAEPARADPACPPPTLSVRVVQTSINSGLAPGLPPSVIAGEVLNESSVDVYVTEVSVSIDAIAKAPGAASGSCDLTDYQLVSTRMPVGVLVHPGGSAPFRGALIGFVDRPVNQDACQGAVLTLKYVST